MNQLQLETISGAVPSVSLHSAWSSDGSNLRTIAATVLDNEEVITDHHRQLTSFECYPIRFYTVNHKKGGRTFVIITLENLDGFL